MRRKIRPAAIMLALVLILNTFAFAADTTTVEAATVPSGETALLAVNDYPTPHVIAVRANTQQPHNSICWAGVTSAIINHYTNSSYSAVSLASEVYDTDNFNQPLSLFPIQSWNPSNPANQTTVQSVLQNKHIVGDSVQGSPPVPLADDLMHSLYVNSSPIIVSLISYNETSAHAVLMNGYHSSPNGFFITLSDPWSYNTVGQAISYQDLISGDIHNGGYTSCHDTSNGNQGIIFFWQFSYFDLHLSN